MNKLEITNLCKSYAGVRAVDGVSLTLKAGSITGLIGPNGAGRSTLLQIISGACNADSGSIEFNGKNITGQQTYERYKMGIVRTNEVANDFACLTVLQNLMIAALEQPGELIVSNLLRPGRTRVREQQIAEQAEHVATYLGLHGKRDSLAADLPIGEKKLLELGRMMMVDADLVLLDEPVAGLGIEAQKKISQLIRGLNKERGYTFCIVEHDMDLIATLCDRVIMLSGGKIVVEGSMSEIRANPQAINAYFG